MSIAAPPAPSLVRSRSADAAIADPVAGVTVDAVTATVEQFIRKAFASGWYSPNTAAEEAIRVLLERIAGEGLPLPLSLAGNLFGGAQCEWAVASCEVVVCVDENAKQFLVVIPFDGSDATEIADPTFAQIAAALKS